MNKSNQGSSRSSFSPRVLTYGLVLLVVTAIAGGWIADRMGYQLPEKYRQPIVNTLASTENFADGAFNSIETEMEAPAGSQEFHYAGQPLDLSGRQNLKILNNVGFIVAYNEEMRNPSWVAYRLDKVDTPHDYERPRYFKRDERTQSQVTSKDYTHSGFDRGHLAPNYGIMTRYGRDAQLQTFLMTNISPQDPDLNRKVWMRLEQAVAKEYANNYNEVWVITGPIYEYPVRRLPSGVAIPNAYFKIIVDDMNGQPRVMAFIMPQSVEGNESFDEMLTTVDLIEEYTGFDFLRELPDGIENQIEGQIAEQVWPSVYQRPYRMSNN